MKKFVADEDIPRPIVEKLRSKGFEIFYIEEELKSASDTEVLEKAGDLELPILTFDDDFEEFSNHDGILHLTKRTEYEIIVEAVEDIVNRIENEEAENSIIKINPSYY